jgi:ACS family hexuronate transporter-like MFS transporter
MNRSHRFPWFTIGMLFAATALSFLDRQVLSTLAPRIISEFGMTNTSYSHVVFAFQASYTLMSALGGWMIDRIGVKRGLGVSLALWSIASAAHAFARSVVWLGVARFILGFGEGACFPAATRGAVEYAPRERRSFATGAAIGGSALGAVMAPPLTVVLASRYGWRGAFVVTGLVGFVWLLLWTVGVSNRVERVVASRPGVSYRDLFSNRRLVWILAARFVFDPVFYFYMFWIPQFLSRERGMSLEAIGNLFWIPFLLLGISQVFFGNLTDWLGSRGRTPVEAKSMFLLISAAITPVSWIAGLAPDKYWAIFFMSLLLFAHGAWITNYLSLLTDIFPTEQTALIVGLTGMVGGISGMLSTLIIGPVVDRFSFTPVFAVSGVVYPISYLLIRIAIRGLVGKGDGHSVTEFERKLA